MIKSDNNFINRWSRKVKAVNYLGGKCSRCGNDNIFVLCFHHKNPNEKEGKINYLLHNRWDILVKELDKCEVLCSNCHRELHSSGNVTSRCSNFKHLCLEYKNTHCCFECGYNSDTTVLEFHHFNNDKKYSIGEIEYRHLEPFIKEELDKCEVLCSNCHMMKHINLERFNRYKNIIYTKKVSVRPDINIVKELLNSGYRQIDIINELNSTKSIIYGLIKKIRNGA